MKKTTDPLEQCKVLVHLDGECPGAWECNECAIYPILCEDHHGDCLVDIAYNVALDLKADLEQSGKCESIWKD